MLRRDARSFGLAEPFLLSAFCFLLSNSPMFDDVFDHKESLLDRFLAAAPEYLKARWIFLRALGVIFFSAFYALWFQIEGLIGSPGVFSGCARLPHTSNA